MLQLLQSKNNSHIKYNSYTDLITTLQKLPQTLTKDNLPLFITFSNIASYCANPHSTRIIAVLKKDFKRTNLKSSFSHSNNESNKLIESKCIVKLD